MISENGKSVAILRIREVYTDEPLTGRAKSAFGHTLKCVKEQILRDRTYLGYIGKQVEGATVRKRNDHPTVFSFPAKTEPR